MTLFQSFLLTMLDSKINSCLIIPIIYSYTSAYNFKISKSKSNT